jgi:hypothetical protein
MSILVIKRENYNMYKTRGDRSTRIHINKRILGHVLLNSSISYPGVYLRKIAPMASANIAFYIYYLLIISPGIHVYVYYRVFAKLLQKKKKKMKKKTIKK